MLFLNSNKYQYTYLNTYILPPSFPTCMRYFRMVVYERVWLGLPVKGGGVTGGPVKQVMSVKEGKGMFFFSVSVFSGSLA